ncbi:FAD-dependent oxidoreductase [Caminibacter mediatlanticus TB-2]|uniref:FAD-dependent oxidoreductase n=1 Tax=Caminibacter mediatlanticus TB-2 TaxID=391592 RepID=A0ABX5V7C3_9BACT|nr:FAD-dependent oxidoreductase [Caminibacter mediatlanticus]QCT94172.1 FAD-dependent oxidoreductase [Caminibacter mediatlanticus TB-2]
MKSFEFIIIGGGIAGVITYLFLKEKTNKILLLDKKEILEGASGAAGAFLFPKIGLNDLYTKFINSSILEAIKFYNSIGINIHTKGVILLPRNEKDFEKFKRYQKEIELPFKKIKEGFYFDFGSVINPDDLKKFSFNYEKIEVKKLQKKDEWVINNCIKTKNIILATGYEKIIDIPYIKIRPVWGERIEIKASYEDNELCSLDKCYFHKNCSVGKIEDIIKIGATHKRDCLDCFENIEEVKELIKKANEIVKIKEYEVLSIKGGFRAASIDYFPVVGKIIDIDKTLKEDKYIIKGDRPRKIFYKEGLYIINGMGGRGFSNAVSCARRLVEYIFENKDLGFLDTKRQFIKWARKEGEEYVKSR